MVDRQHRPDARRHPRELIRSDPELLARIDRNGDGNIDGEAAAAAVAREVYEQELREPPGKPPKIDACDYLILERKIDLAQPKQFARCLLRTLRAGKDRAELARFEQLTTWLEARGRRRHDWDDPIVEYSIRPIHEDQINLRRRPTMLGEEIEVLSLHGRTIARIRPRSRLLQYAYEVRGEDGRTLMLERKPWDERCERGYRRTSGERARRKTPPPPYFIVDGEACWAGFVNREAYFPDEKDNRILFQQWVVRLEEGSLTTALRWGLIGALAFVLHGPSLMRGSIWHFFGGVKR